MASSKSTRTMSERVRLSSLAMASITAIDSGLSLMFSPDFGAGLGSATRHSVPQFSTPLR